MRFDDAIVNSCRGYESCTTYVAVLWRSTSDSYYDYHMAKKNKSKKSQQATSSLVIDDADEELVNDLLAQLESRDPAVKTETASVVQTMHLDERADLIESSEKQEPKSRFKARQVGRTCAHIFVYLFCSDNDVGAQSGGPRPDLHC